MIDNSKTSISTKSVASSFITAPVLEAKSRRDRPRPADPWFGEAVSYDVVASGRGTLRLHPSRVVRFIGNAWPDSSLGAKTP